MTAKTIVLIHGAFHWGGCFTKLANCLAARGYAVLTPDLAGHGHDATPMSALNALSDYFAPLDRLMDKLREPALLVGHSMGGLALSYLGERYADRIERLIYLAAIMLPPGKTLAEIPTTGQSALTEFITSTDDGRLLRLQKDRAGLRTAFYGDCGDRDVDVAIANLTDCNPALVYSWQCDITPERYGRIPRDYIETLEDRALTLAMQRNYQAGLPGARVHTMGTAHSPFFSRPDELADLILR